MKAGALALAWVLIVTCSVFPQILELEKHFFSEQCDFENMGKSLLFATGVYFFDLIIQVLYAIDELLSKAFIVTILTCVTICVLTVPVAISMKWNNIYSVLIVVLAMGYIKALSIYMSDKTKEIKNRQIADQDSGMNMTGGME
ncbi:MAG: hypothetical protein LBQ70_04715 [Prevotellaceae bacterium]|nr:hypothetical protein [Prevotellaceae bacterium]